MLLPATALAHDGSNGGYSSLRNHHHHHLGALMKGTVQSVDANAGTLVVKDARSGDNYTVKAVKGWVADTNNDGTHSISDVQAGDTVLVFTKRRFIDKDAHTVAAAFVIDKTHPKTWDKSAYQRAYQDGARDGNCDRR